METRQVGTVLTQSNENLGPETLVGGEAGLDVRSPFGLGARLTAFDRVYLVGRSGVDTIGQPRFVHGGISLRVGR
jgi:hypothetical protein